jgi:hypothetical protein
MEKEEFNRILEKQKESKQADMQNQRVKQDKVLSLS